MNETVKETGGAGPSHRGVEIGVALAMAILALIGVYGSIKVGIGWGAEGPRAVFFPFYVSLAVVISCAVNLTKALLSGMTANFLRSGDRSARSWQWLCRPRSTSRSFRIS